MTWNLGNNASDTITHIISIVSLAIFGTVVNLIELHFIGKPTENQTYALVVQNIVIAIGMAYYMYKFAITPSSVNIETDPTQQPLK